MKDAGSRMVASEGLSGVAEWVEWAMTTSVEEALFSQS